MDHVDMNRIEKAERALPYAERERVASLAHEIWTRVWDLLDGDPDISSALAARAATKAEWAFRAEYLREEGGGS